MEKEEFKKSVLEYEDVRRAVQYARKQDEKTGYESGFGFCYDSGVEQGIEQGGEPGRIAGLLEDRCQLINGLLSSGFELATFAKATGLNEAEIRELIQE